MLEQLDHILTAYETVVGDGLKDVFILRLCVYFNIH